MNAELLYESLSDQQSLEQLNEPDLEKLVASHPYFSIGQLVLGKKLRQGGDKESYQYQRQYLQTFYRNPWWLFYQLELSDTLSVPHEEQPPFKKDPDAFTGSWPSPEIIPEVTPPSAPFESIASGLEEDDLSAYPLYPAVVHQDTERKTSPVFTVPSMTSAIVPPELPSVPEVPQAPDIPASPQATQPAIIIFSVPYMVTPLTWPEEPKEAPVEEKPVQEVSRPATAFPTAEPAPFPFSISPFNRDLAFEPLHTVDYFASLGIKLVLEDSPSDQLGRHLKSFTEWLRTMKRISPTDPIREELDTATEAEIQHIASYANSQREAVVTESMALVWVHQGKVHKAIEVYNKLSLQHPEKRSYFAAKIDQLKRR